MAKEVAYIAGKFLRKNIDGSKNVLLSKGRDIKLEIDLKAEQLIKEHLCKYQSYEILGEETGLTGPIEIFIGL